MKCSMKEEDMEENTVVHVSCFASDLKQAEGTLKSLSGALEKMAKELEGLEIIADEIKSRIEPRKIIIYETKTELIYKNY